MYGSYLEEKTQDRAFHVVFAQLALWNIGNIVFVLFFVMVRKEIFKQPHRTKFRIVKIFAFYLLPSANLFLTKPTKESYWYLHALCQ